MKKLRKLKDGGAVGNGAPIGGAAAGGSAIGGGLPKNLSDNVRPWIFENDRRLAKVDLKLHELEYMDLTRRENQLINQARVRKQDFLESDSEMVSDDSDGTAQVELNRGRPVIRYISIGAIIALSLLILFIF